MPKIGLVLSGGMTRGAYEIGGLRAILEYFGRESLRCISTSSIGTVTGYGYCTDKLQTVEETWKSIDVSETGRFFPSYSGNPEIMNHIRNLVGEDDVLPLHMYVSIWNFTAKKIEYVPFHEQSPQQLREYICASVSIPIFSKGVTVNGDLLFDGAFLDNIPVFPLLEEDLDYIFCIHFDGCNYLFENEEFDKKIIKLTDFPYYKTKDLLFYTPAYFDHMVQYGYDYTMQIIQQIFATDDREETLRRIKEYEDGKQQNYKRRLTGDVVLNNVNLLTKRYSKRMSIREKKK